MHHWTNRARGHHRGECGPRPHMHPGFGGRGQCFRRRMLTRQERIERLEAYLKDLRLEAQAVEERLADLRAAG
jgi:hypothetical protein